MLNFSFFDLDFQCPPLLSSLSENAFCADTLFPLPPSLLKIPPSLLPSSRCLGDSDQSRLIIEKTLGFRSGLPDMLWERMELSFLLRSLASSVLDSKYGFWFLVNEIQVVLATVLTQTRVVVVISSANDNDARRLYTGEVILEFVDTVESWKLDVIVGMDWLSKRKFVIVCHEKVVRIPLEGDEILQVHGERTQGVVKTLMNTKTRVSYDLVIFRGDAPVSFVKKRGAWSSFEVRVGITEEGEVVTYLRFITNLSKIVKPIRPYREGFRSLRGGRRTKRGFPDFEE
ncbi:hypothetical protein Tco_0704825 [Tanacetum coccineum]|uniref:Uncharacterized protein n=1 Tax=Tanacetum coccineum TaxID=301880 RepID=A0ABQ4Y2X5_9ASTR